MHGHLCCADQQPMLRASAHSNVPVPQRLSQAHIWQMNFMLGPSSKRDVDHVLRVNKDVLRWVIVKRPDAFALSNMPTVRKSSKKPVQPEAASPAAVPAAAAEVPSGQPQQ